MTRRPGKDPLTNSSPGSERTTPRTHLRRHLHLTNCIHLRNHMHMQIKQHKRKPMLDGRRPAHPQLPLRRELTAVRKVKALRDPSTSSSFSSVSVGSSGTRLENNGGAHRDEAQSHEPRRALRRSKGRPGDERIEEAEGRDPRACNGSRVEQMTSSYDAWNGGELGISGARVVELRGRGRRRDCEYADASPQSWDDHGFVASQQRRSGICRDEQCRYRVEERWPGDAEEIARRLIAEQNAAHLSSPHSYMSRSRAGAHAGLSLLGGLGDEITSGADDDSFLESEEDGHAELVRRGDQVGVSSSHMSNSESPLIRTTDGRGRRKPRRPKEGANLRVGLHSRGRARPRRSVHKEAPVVPTMSDELDVSEIPHNGCGMPWYWSNLQQKYKGKSLLDIAGMGFTCAFPEAVNKRKGDSKQPSRSSSRHGSQRRDHLHAPADATPDQSTLSSLDSDANGLPLLTGGEESCDDADDPPPAPEAALAAEKFTPSRPTRPIPRGPKSQENHRELDPADEMSPGARSAQPHRGTSQKYRPKTFKDLVGQSLVVKSLSSAITKNKVAPVYLFAGPRGTGKTSAARIFAAALVCLHTEPHRRPCGLCRECATLTLNRSRVVKEIDAASCSSPADLDRMRSLFFCAMNLSPSPHLPTTAAAGGARRRRVFIVEGCDYLAAEVWNSFLKLLEEPPRNLVFILVAADLDRLPLAATSRCQKFQFGKVKEADIVLRLQTLVERENLEAEEAALALIASRADGSLRDAETTLDQLSLLDRTITLSMVQELVGLVPDDKLLDLLDLALAADTVNTVKGMRELLDSGVDALSLVAQLASLITNILAGTFNLRRETRNKGFFHRNIARREEQQRLRQALKVLAECEKQLRASNDRPTWLTAALLQFAPDRSYLPSSVETSMAPSPIAFDTLEKVGAGEPDTPRLPPPGGGDPQPGGPRRGHGSQKEATRAAYNEKDKEKVQISLNAYLDGRRRALPTGNQLQAKVHPSATEPPADLSAEAEGAGASLAGASSRSSSLVLFDPSRIVGTRDFRVLSRRDLEDVWGKVLDGCRSNVLRQLLFLHATLMALFVARDDTYAVAHVEFRSQEHKGRAERLRSSTCHAFQMALGCPVELKLSLERPPSAVLEEIKASQDAPPAGGGPSTSGPKHFEECQIPAALENNLLHVGEASSSHPLGRKRKKSKTRGEILDGVAGEVGPVPDPDPRGNPSWSGRCFADNCVPRDKVPRRQRSGRRPALNVSMSRQPSGRRESFNGGIGAKTATKWKYPKFKGIENIERNNKRLEAQHGRTRGLLCWQSPQSEKGQGRPPPQQKIHRRGAFFLRLVPCRRGPESPDNHPLAPTGAR